MSRNTLVFTVFALLIALVFVVGFTRVIYARMTRTEFLAPAYSSLRSDPRGGKALYEGLGRLPGVTVERHYDLLRRIPRGADVTALFLGLPYLPFLLGIPEDYIEVFEDIAESGGRVVLSMRPAPTGPDSELLERIEDEQQGWHCDHEECDGPPPREDDPSSHWLAILDRSVSISERWGVTLAFANMDEAPDGGYRPIYVRRSEDLPLPDEIPWHSALYFTELSPDWRVLYERDERPVIIERDLGKGSLVFLADTYVLSNEGLREHRYPALLGWVMGSGQRIVFDESLKGIRDNPGIVRLMRNYGLHGFFVGLTLVALLFIWQSAAPLVPRRGMMDVEDREGRDALDGLTTLLDRSIPREELLDVCLREWERAHVHVRGSQAIAAQARNRAHEARTQQGGVVAGYRAATRCVAERMRRGNGGLAQSTATTNSGKES